MKICIFYTNSQDSKVSHRQKSCLWSAVNKNKNKLFVAKQQQTLSVVSSAMVSESEFILFNNLFWQRHGVGGAAAAGRNLEVALLNKCCGAALVACLYGYVCTDGEYSAHACIHMHR